MKKTLAALAVLGAFAGTSIAADVTLYGIVDMGMNWTQTKTTGEQSVDKFSLSSGQNSGSRFGLKGSEEIGNGLTVGFVLENGFSADDGALGQGGRLFGREAFLFVRGGFGEVALGRYGSLDSGTGSYNIIGTKATAMGLGWDTVGKESNIFMEGDRYDNMITYKTPTFAGVTLYAQASLKKDNKATEDWDGESLQWAKDETTGLDIINETKAEPKLSAGQEGSSDADRYYAIGGTFKAGALNAGLVASTTDYSSYKIGKTKGNDDSLAVTGYVNYDFGMIKPMFAAQYFDGGLVGEKKGYGIVAGFTAPVAGGNLKVTAGLNDAEYVDYKAAKKNDSDFNNMMVGVGYEYPLSKRTKLYTAAGYLEKKTKDPVKGTTKEKTTEVMAGMVHSF